MTRKNWTMIVGSSAFLLVGIVAVLVGASIQTATFRAVVASCIGGVCGFAFDYLAAHATSITGPVARPAAVPSARPGPSPRHADSEEPGEEEEVI